MKKSPSKKSKVRRVFVTLELETEAPLRALRTPAFWSVRLPLGSLCMQAQANVAKK